MKMDTKALLVGIIAILMIVFVSCATLQIKSGPTYTLTFLGEEITITLPEGLPDMSQAVLGGEGCWNEIQCAQHFWLRNDRDHGYVRFFYANKHLFGLGWQDEEGINTMWVYGKGIFKKVSHEIFDELYDAVLPETPKTSV